MSFQNATQKTYTCGTGGCDEYKCAFLDTTDVNMAKKGSSLNESGYVGVFNNTVTTAQALTGKEVRVNTGDVLVMAGGVFSIGDYLISDATGKVVTATSLTPTSKNLVGQALQASLADGNVIKMRDTVGLARTVVTL